MTSCEAACVARGLPNYTFEFHHVILQISIDNNTNANIRMSMCCKGMKDKTGAVYITKKSCILPHLHVSLNSFPTFKYGLNHAYVRGKCISNHS